MSVTRSRVFACSVALLGLALCLTPGSARAQASIVTGLGGPIGLGTNCMPPNDDGSWPADSTGLDLTPAFPSGLHFYSGTYTHGWINNNGSLSFQSAISTYTPDAFPGAPQPMIAPYWADVDTRTSSNCDSGGYPSGGGFPAGATCMNPTSDGVWWSLTPGQMVITWDQVGYYSCNTSPVMTFQMILTSATGCDSSGMDFDVEFRYNQCGWEAGDASGGSGGFCPAGTVGSSCTPAQAGFDSAETPDTNYESIMGSRTAGISTDLCTGSNLTPAQPGVWRFGVRGGNITCPMAGMPCNTGMPGICAQGQLSCTGTMTTTCVPFTTPQPSQCNGLDNNCDGTIDTGPCPVGRVCDGTACVLYCVEGACFSGQTCTDGGLCRDTSCLGVNCPSGERCSDGHCVMPCTGVTCPMGQVCRAGACVDPCAGLMCGMGEVCQAGACVPACPCTACASGQTCVTDGQCLPTACVSVTCPAGHVCNGGSCVDACTGAVCPGGQVCMTGQCVTNPDIDAGMSDAGFTNDVVNLRDSSIGRDAGRGVDARANDGAVDVPMGDVIPLLQSTTTGNCGCRATGSTNGNGWAAAVLALGVATSVRRRRPSRR